MVLNLASKRPSEIRPPAPPPCGKNHREMEKAQKRHQASRATAIRTFLELWNFTCWALLLLLIFIHEAATTRCDRSSIYIYVRGWSAYLPLGHLLNLLVPFACAARQKCLYAVSMCRPRVCDHICMNAVCVLQDRWWANTFHIAEAHKDNILHSNNKALQFSSPQRTLHRIFFV